MRAGNSDSQEQLVPSSSGKNAEHRQSVYSVAGPQEVVLSMEEKQFLLVIERGDCPTVRK
jgi:hypothetical protein